MKNSNNICVLIIHISTFHNCIYLPFYLYPVHHVMDGTDLKALENSTNSNKNRDMFFLINLNKVLKNRKYNNNAIF